MFKEAAAFSGFTVNDLSAAMDFYGQTLGCSVVDIGMGLKLEFPNGHNVFLYQKDDHVPATYTVLNFPVASIDAAIEQLSQKNLTMLRYDTLADQQDEKGVLRGKAAGMGPDIAWFTDPAGNILAVLEQAD